LGHHFRYTSSFYFQTIDKKSTARHPTNHRSVQLVARNCKCSKGLNDVPCVARSCIKYGIANHALRWHHSCIKMHATIWNNAPRSVQLVARNCKCSKGLNNVPCLVRSCIKHEIVNHAPRWNHSCIKMHATIWNNAPCSVQLVVRNRRKDDWRNYIETKVVTRCDGSWTHSTAIARWLTISLHNALLCTTLYTW